MISMQLLKEQASVDNVAEDTAQYKHNQQSSLGGQTGQEITSFEANE